MEDALADFLKNFTAKRFDDIDKYEKDAFIGIGSFGVVYKYRLKKVECARNLPKHIAVKMLHQNLQELLKPSRRVLMTREVHLHGSLKHPNIIECYGYCLVDKAVCLALEYCETDLKRYIMSHFPEERLPSIEVWDVLHQLISGLEYMRDQGVHGIVHRDLKPGNILIKSFDPLRVGIADFGLAKAIKTYNSTFTKKTGTEAYMAPEVLDEQWDLRLSNAGDLGHAGDVYSLGVIGFEITTGVLLPKANDKARVVRAFVQHKHLVQDEQLIILLKSCLAWNPDERIRKKNIRAFLTESTTDTSVIAQTFQKVLLLTVVFSSCRTHLLHTMYL